MSRASLEGLDSLVIEGIREICQRAMGSIIGEKYFTDALVKEWSSAILEMVISELAHLKKPYKYIVACTILQRTGTGLCTATATLMDPQTDSEITVPWNNPYVHAYVHIFALQI